MLKIVTFFILVLAIGTRWLYPATVAIQLHLNLNEEILTVKVFIVGFLRTLY